MAESGQADQTLVHRDHLERGPSLPSRPKRNGKAAGIKGDNEKGSRGSSLAGSAALVVDNPERQGYLKEGKHGALGEKYTVPFTDL